MSDETPGPDGSPGSPEMPGPREIPADDDTTEQHDRILRTCLVQIPYLLVLLCVAVAAALVLFDRWRRGAFVFGSAMLLGAVLRGVLPPNQVGLLQVRGRLFDVATMASVGALVLWLATSIDPLGTD
ncbi:DUF3017 domain-containing protein [Gordonia desulfuricans]|uniref:DUF3017 domain-containing protein n=2 Tax=Gordoniaceae TaxID=85026 RepID=A0A7K3LVK8_9ACTN|nr:DUF3017 domain-containing protein [Gordonia desulfuricans]